LVICILKKLDLVHFGGTKNGLLGCDCLILFEQKLKEKMFYLQKQGLKN
jgi:threonine aldolase